MVIALRILARTSLAGFSPTMRRRKTLEDGNYAASSLTIGRAFTHAIHARDRDLFPAEREKEKKKGPMEREGREREREIEIGNVPDRRRIHEREKRRHMGARVHTHTHAYTHLHVFLWCAIIQAAITRSCRIHPFSGEFFPLPFPQLRPLPPYPSLLPHPISP